MKVRNLHGDEQEAVGLKYPLCSFEDERACCPVDLPDPDNLGVWHCTREIGHDGPHVAHDGDSMAYAIAEDE